MSKAHADYLFVTPSLRPEGGQEALAAWCLQCLLRRGSVSVVTYTEPDLLGLDRMAGTTLATASLDFLSFHSPVPGLKLLRFRLFLRCVRSHRRWGQPCISIGGDMDLGDSEGVLQYLGTPPRYHAGKLRADNLGGARNLIQRTATLLNLMLCDLFLPCRDIRAGQNFTVAVSEWVGEEFQRIYGRSADHILYPPPLGVCVPPEKKTVWGFVCLCRAHPSKEWLSMIAVVKKLRERGHAVCFTMAAMGESEGFMKVLKREAESNSEWLRLEANAPRDRLDQTLRDHHFGLHLARDEGYGMAVAEMLLAGCLTGISDSGGQREIVTEPELRFKDVDDAVEKWDRILSCPDLRQRLSISQQRRRDLYTREVFEARFQEVLERIYPRHPERISPL